MADSTLAETFLGFGGRTGQILGTVFTGVGVLYSINRSTGHGISLLEALPYWLGMKKDPHENDRAITRKNVYDEFATYGKLMLLIITGVTIKKMGGWALMQSTIDMFNNFMYKSS